MSKFSFLFTYCLTTLLLIALCLSGINCGVNTESGGPSSYVPGGFSPANGAEGINVNTVLSWSPGMYWDFYVYFGTSPDPPLVIDGGNWDEYDPGVLNYDTQYYWRVVALYDTTRFDSGLMSFTTVSEGSLVWSYYIGDLGYTVDPAVGNGYVYSAYETGVYCFDGDDGTLIWDAATGENSGSDPCFSGGRIYIGDGDGILYCFNANDGSQIWTYDTEGSIESSPNVGTDKVVFTASGPGNTGYVYFINGADGTLDWRHEIYSDRCYNDSRLSEGKAYVPVEETLYCFDTDDGQVLWERSYMHWVDCRPAVYGDLVIISNRYRVYGLNKQTGEDVWWEVADDCDSSPAVYDGKVFFTQGELALYDSGLRCFNAADGWFLWRERLSGIDSYGNPGAGPGRVYTAAGSSMVAFDSDDGSLVWMYRTSGWSGGVPAVYNDYVYFYSTDGYLYCVTEGAEAPDPYVNPSEEKTSELTSGFAGNSR